MSDVESILTVGIIIVLLLVATAFGHHRFLQVYNAMSAVEQDEHDTEMQTW